MSYSEQVKADAKKAADYIREHGWCQGTMRDEKGRVCAMGATEYCGAENWGQLVDAAFRNELGGKIGVVQFNDRPGRTVEEVLAVFDKIANS